MSLNALRSCQTCGKSVPSGAMACPHDGTPLPGAEPSLSTQTVLPLASPSPPLGTTPRPTPPVAQPSPAQALKPETEQDPLVGRQLGEYVMRQRIGSGGMGVVYLAQRPADLVEDDASDGRERWLPKPFEPARLARMVCEMAPPCPNPPRRVRGMDVMR